MNVLHVRSSSGIYGAENVLLGLLPELARLDASPRLLCIENHLTREQTLFDAATAAGIDACLLPCRGRFDPATLRALSAAMTAAIAHDPDSVVHTHDYKSLFYALLARRGRRIPIVATSHGHFASSALQRIYNRLEVRMMRKAAQVLIVSEEMRHHLVDAGIAADRITLVENGIDTRRFTPDVAPLDRATLGLDADDFVFGTAIRLNDQKNPFGLLDAFAQVSRRNPSAKLLIAGDGPLRERMGEVADTLGIAASLRLVGARKDLPNLYPMLDCFVLPSLFEGLPLALLEAMSAAVPVIATRVGHVPIVLEGLPAIVIAPADVTALADAMRADLERPRRRVAELRTRVCRTYSAERMAQKHLELYRASAAPQGALATS